MFWREEAKFCKQFDDWIILDVAFAFKHNTGSKKKHKEEHCRFNQYIKALKMYSQAYQSHQANHNKSTDSQTTTIEFSTLQE